MPEIQTWCENAMCKQAEKKHKYFTLNVANQAYRTQYTSMHTTLHPHHPHAPLVCYFTVHHAKITAEWLFFLAPLTQMT